MYLKKVLIIAILSSMFWAFFIEQSFAQRQWIDISAKGRKETIWCVDVGGFYYGGHEVNYHFDSIYAVGWSSTQGVFLRSIDFGSSWTAAMLPTLFPTSILNRSDGSNVIAGYNLLTDNAEVVFLDKNWVMRRSYSFDGDSLPYCKNLFDLARIDNGFLVCGTNTNIFKYSFEDSSWALVFSPLNDTMMFDFTRVKTFLAILYPLKFYGLVLGGESYTKMHILYETTDEGDSWSAVYDFYRISPQIELFSFFVPPFSQLDISEIFVSGSIADTAIIWRSTDRGNSWEEFFRANTLNNIIGLHITYTGDIIAVSDKGEIWMNGRKEQDTIPEQFIGIRFFENYANAIEMAYSRIYIVGFGMNGTIKKYNLDFVVNVEEEPSSPKSVLYDEVVIFDVLGRMVARYQKDGTEVTKKLDFFPSGIYFIAKKLNGQVVDIQEVINF